MSESRLIAKEPCPSCGSRDNLARYDDGHAYCFGMGCGYYEPPDGEPRRMSKSEEASSFEPVIGEYKALTKRGISEETCRKFGYQIGNDHGTTVQIANYYNDQRELIAQKLRTKDKDFYVKGKMKSKPLFGQHLWNGGRKIIVTEGEIDALSVSQIQGNKYPVVSIPNGAAGAKAALAENIEYLSNFEEIILMFDNDQPGQDAAMDAASILPANKVKIAKLPMKDANECLLKGETKAVINAIWNAESYKPDGLVTFADVEEEAKKPVTMGIPWFLPTLTEATYGRRLGELYFLGAGTGIGKTDVCMQSAVHDAVELDMKVGIFYLEQGVVETAQRMAGKVMKRSFHVPDAGWTPEELAEGLSNDRLRSNVTMYDSFGVTDWDSIKQKILYLAAGGTKMFYIDHLTALATGHDGNEREILEEITAEMAKMCKAHGIIMLVVSHLATPDGTPHEEGGRVMIRHFKGSRAIGFWAHFMFGLERDQHNENHEIATTTTFRILKDRYTGRSTGKVFYLGYDPDTSLQYEREKPDKEAQSEDYGF